MCGSRSRRALGDQGSLAGATRPELVPSGRGHGIPGQARGAWEDRATQVAIRRQNTRWDRTAASGQATQRQKCKARKFGLLLVCSWAPLNGAVIIFIRMGDRKSEKRRYRQDSRNRTEEKALIELMRQG